MPTASSPLAPKGQLTMATKRTPALLLVFLLLSILLFTRSCEARGLRGHGKGRSSSSKSSHLPGKVGITDKEMACQPVQYTRSDVINKFHLYWLHILIQSRLHCLVQDVETTSMKKADNGWLTRQAEARSTVHTAIDDRVMAHQADAKAKEGVAMASPSTAGTVVGASPVVRVSQRLSRREDTGFHLDYAGPRTHTPSHN